MSEQKYNVLYLFCGCGGLSLGFEETGYNILLGIDIWEDALKTYAYTIFNIFVYDAKKVQTECRTSSLLEYYAEMQPFLCKESANRMQNIKLA